MQPKGKENFKNYLFSFFMSLILIMIPTGALALSSTYELTIHYSDGPIEFRSIFSTHNAFTPGNPLVIDLLDLTSFSASWVNSGANPPPSFNVPDVFGPTPQHQLTQFFYSEDPADLIDGRGLIIQLQGLTPDATWMTIDEGGTMFFLPRTEDDILDFSAGEETRSIQQIVPEPSTWLLFGTGLLALMMAKYRRALPRFARRYQQ